MDPRASQIAASNPDTSLSQLLAALEPLAEREMVFMAGGSEVQAGYHVTEVKAGAFVTLDCGGNPDAWQETILQVEDIPLAEGNRQMHVGKFRGILAQVDRKVRLDHDARVTIEVSRPGEAMRVFDVMGVAVDRGRAVVHLGERPAICKPRHRAAQAEAAACCSPAPATSGACCA